MFLPFGNTVDRTTFLESEFHQMRMSCYEPLYLEFGNEFPMCALFNAQFQCEHKADLVPTVFVIYFMRINGVLFFFLEFNEGLYLFCIVRK